MSDQWIGRQEVAGILQSRKEDIFIEARKFAQKLNMPLDESSQGKGRRVFFRREQIVALKEAIDRYREIGPGEEWINSDVVVQITGYKSRTSALSNIRRLNENHNHPPLEEMVFEGRTYMKRAQVEQWAAWRLELKKTENERKRPLPKSVINQTYNRPDNPQKNRPTLTETGWSNVHIDARRRQIRRLLKDTTNPTLLKTLFLKLGPMVVNDQGLTFLSEEEQELVAEIFDKEMATMLT